MPEVLDYVHPPHLRGPGQNTIKLLFVNLNKKRCNFLTKAVVKETLGVWGWGGERMSTKKNAKELIKKHCIRNSLYSTILMIVLEMYTDD